jgi:hypothetical protein
MKFKENGLLDQMDTYQRNRRFVYSSYLNLFLDEKSSLNEPYNSLEVTERETMN